MRIILLDEFREICHEIVRLKLTTEQWCSIESCDQFQTAHYCGGFDSCENSFTFTYYDNNEYWFQLSLEEIENIANGLISEVEMIEALK